MTREEALKIWLPIIKQGVSDGRMQECAEAMDMAIKALEQDQCGDCIRRSDIGLTDFEIVMCNGDYKEALKMLLDKIEKAPSVSPRPKMGKWQRDQFTNQPTCSKCGYKVFGGQTNYCPNCGAKMPEVEE